MIDWLMTRPDGPIVKATPTAPVISGGARGGGIEGVAADLGGEQARIGRRRHRRRPRRAIGARRASIPAALPAPCGGFRRSRGPCVPPAACPDGSRPAWAEASSRRRSLRRRRRGLRRLDRQRTASGAATTTAEGASTGSTFSACGGGGGGSRRGPSSAGLISSCRFWSSAESPSGASVTSTASSGDSATGLPLNVRKTSPCKARIATSASGRGRSTANRRARRRREPKACRWKRAPVTLIFRALAQPPGQETARARETEREPARRPSWRLR